MSLTFYFAPMSTASVTEAVLAELGTPHTRVTLDISAGDTRKPEFFAVNPNGHVPAIVHDGVAVWESAAITMYLGEMFGVDAKLYPAHGTKRGEAMKWIVWTNVTLAEAGGRMAIALPPGGAGEGQENASDWVPTDDQSPAVLQAAKNDVAKCLVLLDGTLSDRDFLLGDYSLVDTHLWAFVGWVAMMGVDVDAYARVAAWMKRCAARPALAKLG